ncbi:PPE family protein [Mycobacterium scrofulaceum]|uniref:PPE family protein n=1 Tax=Mycobacterium scrofulaceum TaxID=1783 RepID=A0A1X0KDN3_MYCSC|nr:PPE family protein [Mycobacterium scrofulaceum]ORB73323.1 PPE family protein [Mycobacterium scrofulaceum]
MDFAFLPPEINSWRMYSGPGAGPMLAAAGSWDSLSAELDITAATYESVLCGLTSLHWRGHAAESMSAAAVPYAYWLHATADLAKQTAMQARAAAAAYEQAFAMTVPPVAVTANRTQLATLVATNFFGQNAAAIAATEAQYADYWAQDATAMSGYAASSAAATQLPAFPSPRRATTPTATTAQSAAVSKAVNSAVAPVSQSVSAASTLPANPIIPEDFTALDAIVTFIATMKAVDYEQAFVTGIVGAESDLGILPNLGAAAPTALAPLLTAAPQPGGAAPGLGAGLGDVTAALARAGTIGSMSVPASWTAPSSPLTALPGGDFPGRSGTAESAVSGTALPGVPGLSGGTASRATVVVPRYGARITVMARPPAAG